MCKVKVSRSEMLSVIEQVSFRGGEPAGWGFGTRGAGGLGARDALYGHIPRWLMLLSGPLSNRECGGGCVPAHLYVHIFVL